MPKYLWEKAWPRERPNRCCTHLREGDSLTNNVNKSSLLFQRYGAHSWPALHLRRRGGNTHMKYISPTEENILLFLSISSRGINIAPTMLYDSNSRHDSRSKLNDSNICSFCSKKRRYAKNISRKIRPWVIDSVAWEFRGRLTEGHANPIENVRMKTTKDME